MNVTLIVAVGAIGLALVVLDAVFLGMIFYMRRKERQVNTWPSTQGVITASTLESRASEDGYTNYPVVRYSYQVGGQAHKSNRIAPGPEVGGTGAHKVTERYVTGAQVTVFYNPANPADAVLEKRAPSMKLFWVLLIVFDAVLCAGLPLAVWFLRGGG